MDPLLQDLRFAVRTLRRNPGYTIAALLTLMLGIGANTAVVSVVQGVLLAPPPYPEPDRLAVIWEEQADGRPMRVAWRNFLDWEGARGLESLAAHTRAYPVTVLTEAAPLRVEVSQVSRDFLRVLGVAPALGRGFLPEEQRAGADPAVLVSDGFWRSNLGGDRDLSRHIITVGTYRARVVGVMPPAFDYPADVDVWYPLELESPSESRTAHNFTAIARLAPGATLETAEAELDAITRRFLDENPALRGDAAAASFLPHGVQLETLQSALVGDTGRPLWILLGASVLVLLVACTNLASATLARGTGRVQEYAIRRSLGASRGTVVRQLFTEGLVLALAGGGLGILLAAGALRLLPALAPAGVPRIDDVALNGPVLVTALAVTVLTALLFALLPTLRLTRNEFATVVRGGRGGIERGRQRVWKVLIGAEVALALVLLVGSTLLVRSFLRITSVEAGYRTTGLLTATVNPPELNYGSDEPRRRYYDELLRTLDELPGSAQVGLVLAPPMSGTANGLVDVRGGPEPGAVGEYQLVGGDYFQVLDIPLLRGRLFDERDTERAPDVVIVNRAFAEAAWPGDDPIGKQMTGGGMDAYYDQDRWVTVVGVVGDVRQADLTAEPEPTYYFALAQRPSRSWTMTAIVRPVAGDAASLAPAVREAVRSVDPDVPVTLSTIETSMSQALTPRRFTVQVLGVFAATALALACVGIWGVVAYAVARRTREFGIRIALGADGGSVRRLVQRDYLVPIGIGAGVGLLLSFWLMRLLEGLLFEVPVTDPVTFLAAVVVLGGAAWLASLAPAIRATRVTPMETMRSD